MMLTVAALIEELKKVPADAIVQVAIERPYYAWVDARLVQTPQRDVVLIVED